MKKRLKGLAAILMALALSVTIVLPIAATDVMVYYGTPELQDSTYLDDYNLRSDYNYKDVTVTDSPYNLEELAELPEYFNIKGWNIWGADNLGSGYYDSLYHLETVNTPDGMSDYITTDSNLTATAPDLIIAEPIRNDLRKITKQPTADDPTVAVNYPDDATYQWYTNADSRDQLSFSEFTPNSPYFDGFCCGYYADGLDWGYHFGNELDIAFNVPSDSVVKITLSSDNADFSSLVFDYDDQIEFTYNEADNAWYSEKASSYIAVNPEIHGSDSFTATVEVIKDSVSTFITANNCLSIFDGSYDSALEQWCPYEYTYSLDYMDFYVQDISVGTVIKVTPESDDADFELSFNAWNTYNTSEVDGVYYLEFTSDLHSEDDNIYLNGTAPFTAKIEIASPCLLEETAPTLSEVNPGTEYYCVITWPDGFSLTSNTFSAKDNSSSGLNPFIPFLLLMKRMRYFDGDEMVGYQKVEGGEILEPLTLDDKDGMTLEGWYTDKELTEKFDFTQPIKSGRKLYAKWIEVTDEEVITDDDVITEDDVVAEDDVIAEDDTTAEGGTSTEKAVYRQTHCKTKK